MKPHAAHRASSVLVALALLLAAVGPRPTTEPPCTSCAPGCPMHVKRVGCHHRKAKPCHGGAEGGGLRSACRQAGDPSTPGTSALRAVMPTRVASYAGAAVGRTPRPVHALATQHVPEPPTDPPRAPLLPS